MKKISLLGFGEALENARSNDSKEHIMIRMSWIKDGGNNIIKLAKTKHLILTTFSKEDIFDVIRVHNIIDGALWEESTVALDAKDILAMDWIDINEWNFIEVNSLIH